MSVPYEEKNNYIESRLESRFRYFDKMDDLNQEEGDGEKILRDL